MLYRGNFIEGSNPSLSVLSAGHQDRLFCQFCLIRAAIGRQQLTQVESRQKWLARIGGPELANSLG